MPRELGNIPGLNPYNVLLLFILVGLLVQRKREQLKWEIDRLATSLLVIYTGILLVATIRMMVDRESLGDLFFKSVGTILKDDFLNVFKWALPGILFMYGINSAERVKEASLAILVTDLLLALQIIKLVMPAVFSAEGIEDRALRVLDRDLGYHRVTLATLMASGSWGFWVMANHLERRLLSTSCYFGFATCGFAMSLTGGRAGMVSWIFCGGLIAMYRHRKLLLTLPVVAILGLALVPEVKERLMEGFKPEEQKEYKSETLERLHQRDEEGRDLYSITSGRNIVWPLVIEKIKERPWIGWGKYALIRTRITDEIQRILGHVDFPHPHNAYLELVLNVGIIGTVPIFFFYWILIRRALLMYKSSNPNIEQMAGGMFLTFLLVQMVSMMGSLSFYPKQGATLLWCTIGILLACRCRSLAYPCSTSRRDTGSPEVASYRFQGIQPLWSKPKTRDRMPRSTINY